MVLLMDIADFSDFWGVTAKYALGALVLIGALLLLVYALHWLLTLLGSGLEEELEDGEEESYK